MSRSVISIVNRKGGVGKTTMTIALADTIISEHRKTVAVVDADPQASATIALIGVERASERQTPEFGMAAVVGGLVADGRFDRHEIIVGQANRIQHRESISLAVVTNSEVCWDAENDALRSVGEATVGSRIGSLIEFLRGKYDYVLVDCPPGQSVVSSAFLQRSDLILCPTIPDRLSYWGLDSLESYLARHATDESTSKKFFVAMRYQKQLNEHKIYLNKLAERAPHRSRNVKLLTGRSSEMVGAGAGGQKLAIEQDKRFVSRLGETNARTLKDIYGGKAMGQIVEVVSAIRRELGHG